MNDTKKRLLLVDASSYLFRAFHAIRELRSPAGEPTNAIFGVVNMLRKLKQDYPSDYIAAVFDPKGKTFRDDIYPEYKATRQAMPEDLAAHVTAHLSAHKRPRVVHLVDHLPRNELGKVLKKQLTT